MRESLTGLSSRGVIRSCGGGQGCRMLVGLAGCREPQWLALLSGYQYGAGLHQKAALVATIMWDDQACSGLRQVAQLCWSYSGVVHHRKMAQATYLALCYGSGSHARGFINEMKSSCGGGLAV
jgi:hypothetical protein